VVSAFSQLGRPAKRFLTRSRPWPRISSAIWGHTDSRFCYRQSRIAANLAKLPELSQKP